jgi:hypothetical protein
MALMARCVSKSGIAADRAGEVRIRLIGQAEVADVVRAVDRLLHRAQQHGLQQRVGRSLILRISSA